MLTGSIIKQNYISSSFQFSKRKGVYNKKYGRRSWTVVWANPETSEVTKIWRNGTCDLNAKVDNDTVDGVTVTFRTSNYLNLLW